MIRRVVAAFLAFSAIGCRSHETTSSFPCGDQTCRGGQVCTTVSPGIVRAPPPRIPGDDSPPPPPPPAPKPTCADAPRCGGTAKCSCVDTYGGLCQERDGGVYLHIAMP